MHKRKIITNAEAIVTCDERDTVLKGYDIVIEGPRIISICKNSSALYDTSHAEIIDASGKFVYPGLVNTHHHFFQTIVRNLITVDYPSMSVIDWINEIYEIFKLIDSDAVYYSSLIAMADLIKHGCTCAFDHQYCFPKHAGKGLVDRQMEAAGLLGMRFIAGRGANTLFRSEGSTVPDEMVETTEEFLEDCQRLVEKYHDHEPFSMKQIVISPCQPINCLEDTFTESVRLARALGVRMHTHLGEGENELMVRRYGRRSLQWCIDHGFAGPDVWYAHGWELTEEEYRIMAETGTGLSHCPAPAVLGGFPILDLPKMREQGMRIGLGCDGSATNDSSNLLDSLRMAYILQAQHSKERGACPSPYEILKIATAGSAGIMGREDIGVLEKDRAADLFMIDTRTLVLAGAIHDPANLLARAGVTGEVDLTMINGKVVFQNGILSGIDEQYLAGKAEQCATRVVRAHSHAFDHTLW